VLVPQCGMLLQIGHIIAYPDVSGMLPLGTCGSTTGVENMTAVIWIVLVALAVAAVIVDDRVVVAPFSSGRRAGKRRAPHSARASGRWFNKHVHGFCYSGSALVSSTRGA